MTREEFDSYSIEQFDLLKETIQKRNELTNEINDINKSLEPIVEELDSLDIKIDETLDLFNKETDFERQSEFMELLKGMKLKQTELLEKQAELEAQKAEKEEELDNLNEVKKTTTIKIVKNKVNSFKNRLKTKKDGIKMSKKESKIIKEKNIEKVKLSERVSSLFSIVKNKFNTAKEWIQEKTPEVKENVQDGLESAKEWVKEDLKNGVVYNTVETIKEKAPEIKENIQDGLEGAKEWIQEKAPEIKENIQEKMVTAKNYASYKINRTKSAIARTKKNAVIGIKSKLDKVSTFVNGKKEVIVAKTERFINIQKARLEAREERNKQLKELMEQKKKAYEDVKEKAKLRQEEIQSEYQATVKGLGSI